VVADFEGDLVAGEERALEKFGDRRWVGGEGGGREDE
jgi:hypothetical protein